MIQRTIDLFSDMEPEQKLVAHVILQAVIDAQQTREPKVQRVACAWLWECCPDIAEGLSLRRHTVERESHERFSEVVSDYGYERIRSY